MFKYGVVEDILDPLKLGRVRARIAGIHTDNLNELPTQDLPWADVLASVYDASISGIGDTPRLLRGTWVAVSFFDNDMQKPFIIGTFKGIPGAKTNISPVDDTIASELVNSVSATTPPSNEVKLPNGQVVQPSSLTSIPSGSVIVEMPYIGSLTNSQVTTLKATIAQEETGGEPNPYIVENSIGFIGKYQFGAAFLKDMGYINKNAVGTNKEIIDNPSNWTGQNGVTSKEAFFQNIDLQESLMDSMLKNNYSILNRAGILDQSSDPAKTAGLLMAAHLVGAGGAIKYVRGENTTDAYGTSAAKYYQIGYECIAGVTTNEQPTTQNINSPAIDKATSNYDNSLKYDVGIIQTKGAQGFQDPSGEYPLKDYLNESDLNRLARGSKISATIVGEKEADRIKNISVAGGMSTWDQSPIPYATTYPYNRVIASESGHVIEIDDTPGNERLNFHHKAGTFNETDSQGNNVQRTKGIRTVIVDKDELVYIKGSGHVTLDGDLSIKVGGNCVFEIMGSLTTRIHGNFSQEIDGNYDLHVNGYTNIFSNGNLSEKSNGIIALDAINVFEQSGLAATAETAPIYEPVIQIPDPVTRKEITDLTLENSPDISETYYAGAPTVTTQQTDTTQSNNVASVTGLCGFTQLLPSTQLTTNYKLQDLTLTHPFPFSSGQYGLSAEEIACNMKQLTINVIEPLRALYSTQGFMITSCFREAGNSLSLANGVSQHELGQAVDIVFTSFRGQPNVRELYFNIAQQIKNQVPYDQLLLESTSNGSNWIHISFTTNNLRRELLTLYNNKTYSQGLVLVG